MNCSDQSPELFDHPGTTLLSVEWEPCPLRAVFRVSSPADPWPLLYACTKHLSSIVLGLGGDCRVGLLPADHNRLPPARGPETVKSAHALADMPVEPALEPISDPPAEPLLSSRLWARRKGVTVVRRQGWDRAFKAGGVYYPTRDWLELITETEFDARFNESDGGVPR